MSNEREMMSTILRKNNYIPQSYTTEKNITFNKALTEMYYNPEIKQRMIEAVENGFTAVEGIKKELNQWGELTDSEKQAIGAFCCILMQNEGYIPTERVNIHDCANIKTAAKYKKEESSKDNTIK